MPQMMLAVSGSAEERRKGEQGEEREDRKMLSKYVEWGRKKVEEPSAFAAEAKGPKNMTDRRERVEEVSASKRLSLMAMEEKR